MFREELPNRQVLLRTGSHIGGTHFVLIDYDMVNRNGPTFNLMFGSEHKIRVAIYYVSEYLILENYNLK